MRAENRKKAKNEKKLHFLESYFSLKNQFLSIEKLISDEFQKYSLNEILEFKKTLEELFLKMNYIVKQLKKYHNISINIEKRNGFI